MTEDAKKSPFRSAAAGALTLAALWLLTGAGFKLLAGTPNDLPQVVRDVPLELGLTYKLVITLELCVGFLALLQPKWSWPGMVAVFLVFDTVLIGMLGQASCGCFGSSVTLSPALMLAIDSVLLAAILATRPWRLAARRLPVVVVVLVLAAAVALPWLLDRQVTRTGEVTAVDGTGAVVPVQGTWLELDVESWVGEPLSETPLADYVDLDTLLTDGLWVLYRHTCDHCATHLTELAQTETGERMVTLVRLRERNDTEANRVVHLMPEGGFVQMLELPETITYVITTPGELVVENGIVLSAREGF